MKRLVVLASLACFASVLWAVPVVRRTSLASLETVFERTLRGAGMEILALPGGVYLEGYGAVFTADVNLTFTPTINPFNLTIEKPEIDRIYQKKLALLPVLRDRMQQVLLEAGSMLVTVPMQEQITLVVTLGNEQWETTGNLPSQIYMQGQRAKLVQAKLGKVQIATVVKVQEL
jgi:uncharacterized protein (AIM24 family)